MTSDNLDNIYCWTDDGPCEGLNFQFATNYPSLSDDHEKNIMTLSYESSNETGYYPGDVKERPWMNSMMMTSLVWLESAYLSISKTAIHKVQRFKQIFKPQILTG